MGLELTHEVRQFGRLKQNVAAVQVGDLDPDYCASYHNSQIHKV